jgi:hypothetical protein
MTLTISWMKLLACSFIHSRHFPQTFVVSIECATKCKNVSKLPMCKRHILTTCVVCLPPKLSPLVFTPPMYGLWLQSWCLDFRIWQWRFFKKEIGLQLKDPWVVVALKGLQHISHWEKKNNFSFSKNVYTGVLLECFLVSIFLFHKRKQVFAGKNTFQTGKKNKFYNQKNTSYNPKNTFHTGTNKFYNRKKHISHWTKQILQWKKHISHWKKTLFTLSFLLRFETLGGFVKILI